MEIANRRANWRNWLKSTLAEAKRKKLDRSKIVAIDATPFYFFRTECEMDKVEALGNYLKDPDFVKDYLSDEDRRVICYQSKKTSASIRDFFLDLFDRYYDAIELFAYDEGMSWENVRIFDVPLAISMETYARNHGIDGGDLIRMKEFLSFAHSYIQADSTPDVERLIDRKEEELVVEGKYDSYHRGKKGKTCVVCGKITSKVDTKKRVFLCTVDCQMKHYDRVGC
jgi:hypothetical protein